MDLLTKYSEGICKKVMTFVDNFWSSTTEILNKGYEIVYDKMVYCNTCVKLLSEFGIKNINPIFFVIVSTLSISFFYLIYMITHGKVIVYIIDSFFDFLLSLHTILTVQVSTIMIVLGIMYYLRTRLNLIEEYYKSYPISFNYNEKEYKLSYDSYLTFLIFMIVVYPFLMIIMFRPTFTFSSAIFSVFPLVGLSMYVSKENNMCCEYSKYFEKLEKPITHNESFICNFIFMMTSFIFLFV